MTAKGQTAPSSFVTAAAGLAPIADVPGGYSDPPITPSGASGAYPGPLRRGPAPVDQPAASLAQIDLRLGCVCRLLGHDPTRRVIVASYSGDFAAELNRQFRMVVSSEWYAALFPTLRWAKETGLE